MPRSHGGGFSRIAWSAALVLALSATGAGAAFAQDLPPGGNTGEVVVTGARAGCTPAVAGSAPRIDYGCLNGELKTAAGAGRPATPAIDAVAAQADVPSRVGTFSHTATAQRMGKNFGHAAQPYRPPAPVYGHAAPGARPSQGSAPR